MAENNYGEDNILFFKFKKSDITKLILDHQQPINRYVEYANDKETFLKKNTTPYEVFFKDSLNDLVKESDESSILKNLSQYEVRHQIHWLVIKKERQESQLFFWDFALHNNKTDKDEIFIELDDGSHYKPKEDKYIQWDTDVLKNQCIKRFGYYLIRLKAANYMYGFNDLNALSKSDSQLYDVAFIEPYGKPLLIDHLKKCLELALHHKVQPYKGAYICCPDGYKIEGTNTDDKFSESTHKTTYRSDIFSLGNDFQFNLDFLENK